MSCHPPLLRTHVRRTLLSSTAALAVLLAGAQAVLATPLTFTLFNPSSSNLTQQSRLNLTAAASLVGGELTSGPQFAAGGLNGQGSMSTTYNDTATTVSVLATDITTNTITFPGGSTAVANNAAGTFGSLQLSPGVGGTTSTAPGNYGVRFTSPQAIVIPPIDFQGTVVNLGTLSAVGMDLALRNVVIDIVGGYLPLNAPGNIQPQTFDSSLLQVGLTANADIALTATLTQPDLTSWAAAALALNALKTSVAAQGIIINITSNPFSRTNIVKFGLTQAVPLTFSENTDGTLGKLEHISSNYRLTVPVKFDATPALPAGISDILSLKLGLSGQVIGQVSYTPVEVPEPSSVVLGAIGSLGLGWIGYRKRRRA